MIEIFLEVFGFAFLDVIKIHVAVERRTVVLNYSDRDIRTVVGYPFESGEQLGKDKSEFYRASAFF